MDLASVKGTEPDQRIMSSDLAKAQPSGIVNFNRREAPVLPGGTFEEQTLSPIRKVISQRLQESKSFIPHFYITQVIDAEPYPSCAISLRIMTSNSPSTISLSEPVRLL